MRDATATIDLDAIAGNLQRVRARVGGSKVLAVVKADGYGHGLERVARALRAAEAYGVAGIEDAQRLRELETRHGWPAKRIVLLSGFDDPADLTLLHELKLDSVVHDPQQLRMLELDRARGPRRLRLWLKLDTGMHRLGFPCAQAAHLAERLSGLPSAEPVPVWMSHFASADQAGSTLTGRQIEAFEYATAGLPGERSLANSAAILTQPNAHADWVRPGGLLYGLSSFDEQSGPELGFVPAMTLSSRLIATKTVAAGETIGYGESFRCPHDMRIGIASIGYGDGYPRMRSQPGGFEAAATAGERHDPGRDATVLVEGRPARVLGRVSMDLLCIDLAGIEQAQVGSPVILWGPELPAETVARAADTISYELTCGITRRVRVRELGLASQPLPAPRLALAL